uniref:Translocase of inner mitochondrial membrane 17B n=1 Tax=Suricata suricatta TaxID=37032 RepID=A0A673VQI5_SURSU
MMSGKATQSLSWNRWQARAPVCNYSGGVGRPGFSQTARPDAGAMEEYAREPCPWRIVDDCGGAFTMGVIGGGVFQAIKGFRNAPVKDFTQRQILGQKPVRRSERSLTGRRRTAIKEYGTV